MKATLFADASHCGATGAAGWAGWMVSDGRTSRIVSGEVEAKLPSSGAAEAAALAGTLREARASGHVGTGDYVVLQSDSLAALGALRWAVPSCRDNPFPGGHAVPRKDHRMGAEARGFIAEAAAIVAELGLRLSVRHVKGHRTGGGRQWVNAACDREAKAAMRRARSRGSRGS